MSDSVNNSDFESYKKRISNIGSEFEWGVFTSILKRSIKFYILFAVLISCGVLLILRYSQPVYESKAVLQINSENKAREYLNVFPLGSDDYGIDTEIEFLKSPLLVKNALQVMNIKVGYFTKGQVLEDNKYKSNSFEVYDIEIIDSSVIGFKFFINFSNGLFEIVNEEQTEIIKGDYAEDELIKAPYVNFRIRIISDVQFVEEINADRVYFKLQSPKLLLNEVLSGLEVSVLSAKAKTIEVKLKHINSKFAADFVNTLLLSYDNKIVERKNQSSENILSFIGEQKDTVEVRLKDNERMIQVFQKDNDFIGTSGLTGSYLNQIKEVEEQLVVLKVESEVLAQVDSAVTNFGPTTSVQNILEVLIGRSYQDVIQSLISQLQIYANQREEFLTKVTLKNENVVRLDNIIKNQIALVLKGIEIVTLQNKNEILVLESRNKILKAQLFSMPEKELELTRLNRIMGINNKYYTILLEKEAEYMMSAAGVTTQNKILDTAEVTLMPISPNKKLVYIIAIVFFFLMCAATVVIRYILHDKITSLTDINKMSNATLGVLGIVPFHKSKIPNSQLIIDKSPKSLISESFRSLRSNMEFISNFSGPKTVGITSTISGEGKTFVALNLAGIIAYSGKKVIILDLDMRKPKIHIGFGVENLKGMSTLLIEKDELKDCIKQSSLDNLDFITAGPIPPNPSELILNGKVFEIMEELKKTYDIVVVDNPPVGLVTDGVPIIKEVDYPLYVFRSEYSRKSFIQNADRLMNESGITKLSVILNGVNTQAGGYSGSNGYGYGYGYGSGSYGGYYTDDADLNKKSLFKRVFSKKR
jgi:tyrosine-protein kinase Etk/Wzc